ncbi:histidine kinase [Kitasatospora sp. NPDC093558]|uniref:sensor histidine kinase n=1 Tax=Kitasatospora sp. NPDC093558 TaxID=3155201 RepID=UPI00341FCEF2
MPRFIAPLLAGATYARWLHLLIGWIFVGVALMIYPGTYRKGLAEVLVQGAAVDAVLLALVALVPAMRRAEGIQARLLLVPDREEDIAAEPSRTWADRRRTAAWLIGRVALGTATGFGSVAALTVGYALLTGSALAVGGLRLPYGTGRFWYPLAAPVLLFGYGWLIVWAGRLQLAMAVRLLSPSPAERLAEAELRAERLLERNRLARELHDSIGHALTVTVLQAGAAREVGDPAFAAKALEVIEETGRRAMDDLERTLVLLRETPDRTATDRLEGTATESPGIEQLPALFDTARTAGSPVDASIDVPTGTLPGVLSRESYRIVQEALTNALKYAPGEPVAVRIGVRDGQLELHCANPLRDPSSARGAAPLRGTAPTRGTPAAGRGGKGLRGIRERAVLLGGEATVGATGQGNGGGPGEWVLAVRLPLRLGS